MNLMAPSNNLPQFPMNSVKSTGWLNETCPYPLRPAMKSSTWESSDSDNNFKSTIDGIHQYSLFELSISDVVGCDSAPVAFDF
ncbi:unnamed protein product [[Candida] boidinii]|nr:unnamed protein product [[Candida] boidinii]